jgi:hypothetical protein
LSPQLYVLGVDALGRLVQCPWRTVLEFLLYADNVVMFCLPTMDDIVAVSEILQLFGHAKGLQVNFVKSSATAHSLRPGLHHSVDAMANLEAHQLLRLRQSLALGS